MKIYNSLTNKLEEFKTISNNEVKMYVCGPTVYNYIHIGNARPLIVFDVLFRFLKFKGYNVKFVQNFTDIDDKIIRKSLEENISVKELTNKYINAFLEDIEKLNISKDVIRPRVSENIDVIIEMIEKLIENGYAYQKNGNVFFDVKKYSEYGKLSNQKIENLENGVRIENNIEKNSPMDFTLWKKKKEGEIYFDSPFSDGRPGWHIECSSLIKKYLGDNIDIHGGGIDLIFPHHENEIAQSECICKNRKLANFWLHNGHLEINGLKMSKSLKNFIILRDIFKEYSGNEIKFFMLLTHYRKPLDFSKEGMEVAKKTLISIINTIDRYNYISTENSNKNIITFVNEFENKFRFSLENDLNTPEAISHIFDLINKVNKEINNVGFKELKIVVQIIEKYMNEIFGINFEKINKNNLEESLLNLLLKIREKARLNKNYELSDMIRDELLKLGIKSFDKKNT